MHRTRKLQLFYNEKGLCSSCSGNEPLAKGHKSLGENCRKAHYFTTFSSNKRQSIYRELDKLFLLIPPQNKEEANKILSKIIKKVKALYAYSPTLSD